MLKCVVLLLFASIAQLVEAAEPARFDVVYSEAQDHACATDRDYQIREEWVSELKQLLPTYREQWAQLGSAMFSAAEILTRRSLASFITPVQLTLCDVPSQSFVGPRVNMRYALRSFTNQPVPLRSKVDTAFHESLHAFVSQYEPRTSPQLAAHLRESSCVLNHLHLLALQKAVLLALDDRAGLERLVSIDSQLPSGCYKRAWAIINATEGTYKQYVAELAGPT
jgi:hypothetical protein